MSVFIRGPGPVIQTEISPERRRQFNQFFRFDKRSPQTTIPFVLILCSLSNFELIWPLE